VPQLCESGTIIISVVSTYPVGQLALSATTTYAVDSTYPLGQLAFATCTVIARSVSDAAIQLNKRIGLPRPASLRLAWARNDENILFDLFIFNSLYLMERNDRRTKDRIDRGAVTTPKPAVRSTVSRRAIAGGDVHPSPNARGC